MLKEPDISEDETDFEYDIDLDDLADDDKISSQVPPSKSIIIHIYHLLAYKVFLFLWIVPEQCSDEVKAVESFDKYFCRHYHMNPCFYHGSLLKACEIAFYPTSNEQVRPVRFV